MPDSQIQLFVEGHTDEKVVSWILQAVNYPPERFNIQVLGGKNNIVRYCNKLPPAIKKQCAFLIDSDRRDSLPQAIQQAHSRLGGNEDINIFCAIPEVEAWLFADDQLALQSARHSFGQNLLNVLPLPEGRLKNLKR